MDNPEQTTTPALDKVAAALAELGQGTAAAIAERAGVGYSTATKKLRVLEEAGQAEPYRAEDGRTLWRRAASAASSTDGDDAPASTSDAKPLDAPAPPSGEDEGHEQPDEPSTPADDTTEPDEPTAARPHDADAASSDAGVDRPTLHDPPDESPTGPAPSAEVDDKRDEPAETAGMSDSNAATVDETDTGDTPASTDDSVSASAPAEDPSASTDGKPRRSKGTLRGAILDVLEAHPDQQFKTSQLCKAIDKANEGSGSAKASAGAVVNAVHKLVADNLAVQVVERPAAFQLAPKAD
ncbi:hypothetical protein [Salinispora arenicola]|uniref:hypothetical protein n=1 Tax=Salinispora arenicola TaxID=168697 RepID=UPI00039F4769|nr:hypothetical protein [Salinispora arenicola]